MKITLLLTADYATIEPITGKLNILGAFGRIHASSFPCVHPRLVLVAKLRAAIGDHHENRNFVVELVDEDATKMFRAELPFSFRQTGTGRLSEHSTVMELNGLPFPHSGIYNFIIYVDDEELERIPLELVLQSEQV